MIIFQKRMFLVLDNTMDTNNPFEQVKSNDQTAVRYFIVFCNFLERIFQTSASSNSAVKRSFDEDMNIEIKKMKIETPMLEQKVLMPSATNANPPKFVSAATMAVPIPEITDEELLEFTLEFEREHGI